LDARATSVKPPIRSANTPHALNRIATPEEIARSVLYLASDGSSFTTGPALLVDGRVSINRTWAGASRALHRSRAVT
jgi:NAD(P)-dependent dehydrogenase (short-subunit alcohol dehydrogenase family)